MTEANILFDKYLPKGVTTRDRIRLPGALGWKKIYITGIRKYLGEGGHDITLDFGNL